MLRIVGERFGPVIQTAPGHRPPATRLPQLGASVREWPAAIPIRAALLVAGALTLAAVLGFVLARSARGGSPGPVLARPVADRLLGASFPSGWALEPSQRIARMGLTDGLGAGSDGRLIAVGKATSTDPSLLPASVLSSLHATPVPQLVTLDGTTFYRYSPSALGDAGGSRWIYTVPTSSGTVLAICRGTSSDNAFGSLCQRVAQSIRLRFGSISPGLVPAYASALSAVINRLNAARTTWDAQLTAARTAVLQANAAGQLAAAHAQAAASLSGLAAGPARSSNEVLVSSLRADADAYNALADAAAHRRKRAYRISAAAVAQANAAVTSALAALGSFGYRVG